MALAKSFAIDQQWHKKEPVRVWSIRMGPQHVGVVFYSLSSTTTLNATPPVYLAANYAAISTFAVVLYDWMINLPREVETFWTGDARALSASLYFGTRLVSLAMATLEAIALVPWSDKICSRGTRASVALGCVSYIPLAVFSALRAYALSKRRALSVAIFIFFAAPFVTDAVRLNYVTSSIKAPVLGCSAVDNTPPEMTFIFFLITRGCAVFAMLADAFLLAITWQVLRPPGQRRIVFSGKGLVYVIFRDGAMYFIILMILNATDLVFLTTAILRAPSGISNSETNAMAVITTFRTFLPPVLVSRFLLDLQEAHRRKVVVLGSHSPLDTSSSSSSSYADRASRATESGLVFGAGPALGALGATIDPVDWEPLDDEEEGAHAAFAAPRRGSVHLEDKVDECRELQPPGGDGDTVVP